MLETPTPLPHVRSRLSGSGDPTLCVGFIAGTAGAPACLHSFSHKPRGSRGPGV